MPNLSISQLMSLAWSVFLIVWLLAAAQRKPDKATEPLSARLLTLVYICVAFFLLFSRASMPFAWLDARFMPHEAAVDWIGVAFTWLGVAIAIWARFALGDNWSARVNVKVGHQLIRSGPYAYVRHPIYSGLLLAVIGTAVTRGEWRGLIAIVLVGVVHSLKAQREEQMMVSEFGEAYAEYCRQTGFLVPRF